MKVKPAEGRAVRDPTTRQLMRPEGRDVPDNQFWRRRLRDGDVVRAEDDTASPPDAGTAEQGSA